MSNMVENKPIIFDDMVSDIQTLLVNYQNQNVDEYNKVCDEYDNLKSSYDSLKVELEKLRKSNNNNSSNKSTLADSLTKEMAKVKERLSRAKETAKEYRKLYEDLKAKGSDKVIYELQRKLKNIELVVEKYNISCKDELGRNDHVILHFYDDDTSDDQVHCIIDTIHHGALSYRDPIRNGFPLDESRPIDIELVITYSTGICLQVLFSKFGNFIIPQISEGKPYGITKEIIDALEKKRDMYFKLLPNNKLIKRINVLKSINISSIYTEGECKVLYLNEVKSLYDLTNYFSNLDITLLKDVTHDTRNVIVKKAIDYLDKEVFNQE